MTERPFSKHYVRGTHRNVSPEDTVSRLRPLLNRFGITRVANVTGLDWIGIPVVMVCRPNARSLSVAQGKGLTLAAAQASGIMESIEAYHAEHIRLPLELASYADLTTRHRVADYLCLPRRSSSTFHPDRKMLWIQGRDLRSGEPVRVPYELVHSDYTLPFPTGSGSFAMTSNGLGAGNNTVEAISHAIYEAVERDAERLWSTRGPRVREDSRVDLQTVDDEDCLELLERFDGTDIDVAVWEMTSDVALPVYRCMIGPRTQEMYRPMGYATGSGCHADRGIALARALTEAAQSRLTQIAGSRDDIDRASYAATLDPAAEAANVNMLRANAAHRHFTQGPSTQTDYLDDDLSWQLACLAAVGLDEVVVVDLTQPEFGIDVVRVVIPGLEGPDTVSDLLPGRRALAVTG